MTATFPDSRLPLTVLAALVGWACEPQPAGPDLDPGELTEVDCSACHVLADLARHVDDQPPRDWIGQEGEGVVLTPGGGGESYGLPWPERGHHDDDAMESCAACHPVHGRTSGHGLASYDEEALRSQFLPGSDCATSCHPWLQTEHRVEAFLPTVDAPTAYSGSFHPALLLAADALAEGSHGRLWAEGGTFGIDGEGEPTLQQRVSTFEAGCGGCHNRFSSRHGVVVTCLECHRFATATTMGLHEEHILRIDDESREIGLGDRQACVLCHCRDEGADELCRPACYNCHLSGHSPSPVLWFPGTDEANAEGQ